MYCVINFETDAVIAVFFTRGAAESFCRVADPLYLFLDVIPLPLNHL